MTIMPIEPMKAHALREGQDISDFNPNEYVLEVKYDGHRLVSVNEMTGFTGFSSAGNIRALAPHIARAARLLPHATFDGELIIPGGTSTDVTALELIPKSRLVLFDMLKLDHAPLMHLPLYERRALLQKAVSLLETDAIVLSEQFRPDAATLKTLWARGEEGGIVKRLASSYQPGKRSRDWVKFKKSQAAVLTIIGFEDGLLGPHSKVVCQDDRGVVITVKTLNDQWRDIFATTAEAYVGRKLVISFQQKTSKGAYRHPMMDHIL